MNKIKYKNKSDLILYDIHGIFFYDYDRYMYYFDLDEEKDYYSIFGEFYYCGLVIDAQLLLEEKKMNEILKIISPEINIVRNDI